jgi:hypothetical protein
MDLFGSMVRMPAVAAWPALPNLHGHSAPAKFVARFAKMRFASTEKRGNVAAEKALERDMLVAMCLAGGREILFAV